jgi:hypothetical protein
MIANLRARLAERRAHRDSDPHPAEEFESFREIRPEGKALRRRRRKVRLSLLRGDVS